MLKNAKTITVLGGGTGTFVVLSGLKKYPIDLGVIVSMMDSGGSTGRLRDQLGVLPPGDLRQCLVALSDAPDLWRKLFLYRFDSGDLKGHNFGNIFLSALEKVSGAYDEVLEAAEQILHLKGEVIPVTYEKTHVSAMYENGVQIDGEDTIDENTHEKSKIKNIFLQPAVSANPKAIARIVQSDYLIIGPGDLYTSIIPIFLVEGIKKAIGESRAKIIYIMNLMTKSGQTTSYTAKDHIRDLEKYMGKAIDIVIVNNGNISRDILEWYEEHDEKPVLNDIVGNKQISLTIIQENLTNGSRFVKDKADAINRTILRHDEEKLAKVLNSLIS